ncbi:MAG: phage tail length tape measure family protein, partial [Alphaproteobacteria bacterium]|nr:phage tail length tape measure family protein [Alphaproteobacteria bacterium]
GRIGPQMMGELIARTKDYAATMGMDLVPAAEELARSFANPAQGAQDLNKALQSLSDAEAQEIVLMFQRGDLMGAQLALLKAVDEGTVKHGKSVTALGVAWGKVANAASNAWDAIGKSIDKGFSSAPATEAALARLIEQRDRLLNFDGPDFGGTKQSSLAALNAEIARMQAEIEKSRQIGGRSAANARSVEAGNIARSFVPDADRLAGLRAKQQQLGLALADPAMRGKVQEQAEVQRAYDAVTRSLDSYLAPAQKVAEQHRIELAALNAKTPAQRAEIAAQRERLQLAGETLPAGEAEARIEAARASAYAEAAHAISEQNTQLSLNTQLTLRSAEGWLQGAAAGARAEAMQRGLADAFNEGADAATRARLALQEQVAQTALSGAQTIAGLNAETVTRARLNSAVLSGAMTLQEANRQASLEAELRPLIIARDNAEGTAKEVLTRIIEELTVARARLNEEEGRAAAASIVAGQEDRLTMLRREADLVFAGTTARERELAILSETLSARRAGVAAGSDEERQIRENAAAISDFVSQLEREGQARDIVMRTTENALDRVADQLAQGKLDWASWGDLATSVLQDVIAEIARMAITAPIMNSLFGTRQTTLGDVGGIIGGLFGSFHSGGLVGKGSNDNRILPLSTFRDAPRFHKGGLVSGERAIIALDTEEVLTEDDPRHIKNVRRVSGGGGFAASGGALA